MRDDTSPADQTRSYTDDEQRAFLRGKLRGIRECSQQHSRYHVKAYDIGYGEGYTVGRRQGAWAALAGVGLLVAVAVRWRGR